MAQTKKARRAARATSNKQIWITAAGQPIRIGDLGDDHLVNCLKLIETELGTAWPAATPHTKQLRYTHLRLYGAMVTEAIVRGLFDWAPKRKYLAETSARIEKLLAQAPKKAPKA